MLASLGFRTDLMIRRVAGSEVTEHAEHIVVRTPANPAYHWGNFIIALEDVADAERWLATFRAEFPDAAHVAIGLDTEAVDARLRETYDGLGLYVDVSEVLAARTLTASSDGIDCRALSSDADWEQLLDVTLATHEIDSPVEVEFATRKQAEMRRLVESGSGVWFGAFADGRVRASLGILTDGGGVGRYQSVETHPDNRRRGFARALLAGAGEVMLREFGVRELVIVADPEYHAIGLYRSVGVSSVGMQVQVGLAS